MVKKQVADRMDAKSPSLVNNVEALRYLSSKLHEQLHMALSLPHLMRHPIFTILCHLDETFFQSTCFRFMKFVAFNRYDLLFDAGCNCNETYVISPDTALVTQYRVRK